MTDSQLGLDDMCGFLEVAGCTFPVRELTDKNKIISACVQFHLVDRVHSCMERYVVNNSLTCLHAVCLQDKMKIRVKDNSSQCSGTVYRMIKTSIATFFALGLHAMMVNCCFQGHRS